ncbi:hypothetical protein NDU88_001969 [Pleurodeles waltl]|uniref:Uncharacterized protein n=1 Tax=Pleurodeles waltl TaxID=8319 RepID=A0AAV7RBD7_PLEWA|nr:hypothetical protein NDU88_001969 [Pleurodeles waltl]
MVGKTVGEVGEGGCRSCTVLPLEIVIKLICYHLPWIGDEGRRTVRVPRVHCGLFFTFGGGCGADLGFPWISFLNISVDYCLGRDLPLPSVVRRSCLWASRRLRSCFCAPREVQVLSWCTLDGARWLVHTTYVVAVGMSLCFTLLGYPLHHVACDILCGRVPCNCVQRVQLTFLYTLRIDNGKEGKRSSAIVFRPLL